MGQIVQFLAMNFESNQQSCNHAVQYRSNRVRDDYTSWLHNNDDNEKMAKNQNKASQSMFRETSDTWLNTRCEKPICELPEFNGNGSLKLFKQQFNDVCYINGWNKNESFFWLKQCLKGQCQSLVYYNSCQNIESIWFMLNSRYGDHLLVQKYQRLLPNRKRNIGEPLSDLADDIRKMINIVFSEVSHDQRERFAIQHFIRALDNPAASYDLSGKKPQTLEEALHMATVREMYFSESSVNNGATSNTHYYGADANQEFPYGYQYATEMGNISPISHQRP